tara:strand:+ start:1886 stop:2278 length:393 start_codon:yes stop_codon:yes gene_type:complete
MKKILTIVALLFLGMVGVAQLRVYTAEYEICFRDDVTGLYSDCRYDTNFISGFVFNELKTSFEHSTYNNNLTSTYYIDSTINEVEQDVYYTASDQGNKYLFIFNYKEEEVVYIYPIDGSYSIATRIKIVN